MSATIELLNRLAAKLGDASDYRIAAELGIGKGTVSKWRVGKGTMGEDNALKVAEILEEDPKFVLTQVLAERTRSTKAKQVLRQIAAQLKRTAAVVTLAIFGILGVSHAPPARAASAEAPALHIMANKIPTATRTVLSLSSLLIPLNFV